MKYIILVLICFAGRLYSQGLYTQVITYTHRSSFKEVVALSPKIQEMEEGRFKNDLKIALAYAHLNLFQYDECLKILSGISRPDNMQSGSIHQIQGLYFLLDQKYKKAGNEFSLAMEFFNDPQSKTQFFEASNNLAYSLNVLREDNEYSNILTDRVIEYCESNGDSILLSYSLMNKSLSYPTNAIVALQKA
ncbi:MAG TPA: hypothetical protein VGQ59_19150, partial [Cyclobacteriaceae bacterium]|nr:hypothetical protein [Cyclobacteriaceae bacterium]